MTGLLISVRSAAEAKIALAGGADLIDVKEPARGPLGAADPAVWDDVRRTVAGRVPTSVALGELLNAQAELLPHSPGTPSPSWASPAAGECPAGKILWQQALAQLPAGVRPVAVIYADHAAAGSPNTGRDSAPGRFHRLRRRTGRYVRQASGQLARALVAGRRAALHCRGARARPGRRCCRFAQRGQHRAAHAAVARLHRCPRRGLRGRTRKFARSRACQVPGATCPPGSE